jgi:uncharacterized protein YegP (UPF0339 family)
VSVYPAVLEVYQARDGWRWRLTARNGNIIVDSGQAYSARWRAKRAAVTAATVPIVLQCGDTQEVLR